MDPQSQSFTPQTTTSAPSTSTANNTTSNSDGWRSESWRLQTDVARLQQVHAEHAERLARLERRQDDDARLKSVWGTTNGSPFPSVLSGTPQTAPLQQPSTDHFRNFDDANNNHLSSLHLDAEEEPRRGIAATSRANSVRFDETANQNHFTHSSRPSVDFLSRTSSGYSGGNFMTERTASHKSDGRASSAHSMRSVASGRANSLNLDSTYSPLENPGLAPGLLLLGAVPAIIRCWMNTNFKHDALLYAAVCTGSYKSFLDLRLIQKLGFEELIVESGVGYRTVKLPIFFPEAVPHPASSRSSSPVPQLPSLLVDFRVIERSGAEDDSKALQIFLGSDVLRAHNADILFSSNSMTLFDSERNKLSIPLSRPENEGAFNTLCITSAAPTPAPQVSQPEGAATKDHHPYLNGLGPGSSTAASVSSLAASPPPATTTGKYRPPGALLAADAGASESTTTPAAAKEDPTDVRPTSRLASLTSRPSLSRLNTRGAADAPDAETSSTPSRTGAGGAAIWGNNWRREGSAPPTAPTSAVAAAAASSSPLGQLDWGAAANRPRGSGAETPAAVGRGKEGGIKVLLKPKAGSRAVSVTSANAAPAGAVAVGSPLAEGGVGGRSRFFEEGRRRSAAGEGKVNGEVPAAGGKTTTKANPIGGASAFSWLAK